MFKVRRKNQVRQRTWCIPTIYKGSKLGEKTLYVNAQGMCQQLGEPKSKINTYCMNLKRHIERWNKIIVQNGVRMYKMRNMYFKTRKIKIKIIFLLKGGCAEPVR
jgi:hypothetical protein